MRRLASLRRYLPLLALGGLSELIYAFYFLRQFPLLEYYKHPVLIGALTGYSHSIFASFIGEFVLLFILFGLAWWQICASPDRNMVWPILGLGAVFLATMVFVYPLTAVDPYLYAAASWMMVHYHQNPMAVPPSRFARDPLVALIANAPHVAIPYGPLGIAVDAIPTLLVGRNLLATLLLLKAMFSAMVLADAFIVFRLLERIHVGWALSGALLVTWNPLVVYEIGAHGHNDAAVMLFALLALLSMAEGELVLGPVLLLASTLVKYSTVVLLPLLLAYGFSRQPTARRRAVYALRVSLAMTLLSVIAYVPFWEGPATFQRTLQEGQIYFDSFAGAVSNLLPSGFGPDRTALLGRILLIPLYLYLMRLACRQLTDLLRASFLVILLFLVLGASSFQPWYCVWPAMLAAAVPRLVERVAGVLLAFTTTVSNALYNFVVVWLSTGRGPGASFQIVNTVAYVVTFLPPLLVLALLTWSPFAPSWPQSRAGYTDQSPNA